MTRHAHDEGDAKAHDTENTHDTRTHTLYLELIPDVLRIALDHDSFVELGRIGMVEHAIRQRGADRCAEDARAGKLDPNWLFLAD